MILIELTAAVDATGAVETFYVSDSPFVTEPTDIPANTAFDETVLDPGSIVITAFGDGRTGGGTRLSPGEIRLANSDGQYDAWLNYGFDGRAVIIRQGESGAYPDDYTTLFTGTVEALTVTRSEVTIRLRDKQLIFDRPVLTTRYAGTNSLPNGLEGTADDIKGQPKPRLYGKAFNISPPLVNTSKLTYQITDGTLASIEGVYDQGASLTFDTDYATSDLLQAASVSGGTYATCLAEGYFRLGATPAGTVTCDATQGNSVAQRTAAQILSALGSAAGLESSEISFADIATLDGANNAVVGIWLSSDETYTTAMDKIAGSVGAWYGFDPTGVLRMARLEAPNGVPIYTLTDLDIIDIERRPARDGDLPAWSYTIRHSKYWTIQETDIASSVTAARRAALASEYRAEKVDDATVKDLHLLATEETADTLLTSAADAATEATRRLDLFKVHSDFFDVVVPASILTTAGLQVGAMMALTNNRFGLSDGRLFVLLGIKPELARNRATLTLWGPPTVIPPAPELAVVISAPVISGATLYGGTLTTTDGVWSGTLPITYTYQWNRDGTPITGETGSTYTTTSTDIDTVITCTVTARNSAGAATQDSNSLTITSFLAADITIFAKAGQSNSLGQDALPMPERTPSDFAIMLDTNKPGTSSGTFGSTFTQAVGQEYIFGGTNHQGDTMCLAIADRLERLIEDIQGQTYAEHGKQVIVVDFGLSSSNVAGFAYGTTHFANVMAWCNAVKAAADALGKTVRIGGLYWAWSAYAYANNVGYATAKASIESYCGPSGDLATHILPIFGQTGETIPVGFMGAHHHYQATNPLDPFVAQAEQDLCASDPDRYSHIDAEGVHHLNGLDYGLGGSSTHMHPNEEEEIGGLAAWWFHSKVVLPNTAWPNMIPTFARGTGARQLIATIPDFPDNASISFRPTGLTPTIAQPNHGWWTCDPSTPTVEITNVRPPYPGPTPGTIIFDYTADLPTPVEVRYGARDSSHLIAGNTVIAYDTPLTTPIQGVETALTRSIPALKVQVA